MGDASTNDLPDALGPAPPRRAITVPARLVSSRAFRAIGPRVVPRMHRAVHRLSRGRTLLGGAAQPLGIIVTVGARSGHTRESPIAVVPLHDGRFLVAGSNFARESHPAWTTNLRANPRARLRLAGAQHTVVARQLEGDERRRHWMHAIRWFPGWVDYEQITEREIRLFELTPIDDARGAVRVRPGGSS